MQTSTLESGVTPLGTRGAAETEADFSEFFTATWPRAYRTALTIARDPGLAEDALQTAYARAYARWRSISVAEHPEAYVRRMVVNEVLGTFRRPWWRLERATERLTERGESPSPEGPVLDRHDLLAALAGLPPGQRAVLVLRYYEDLSEAQIADVLGVSRGTVKSQASAALAALRAKEITR